ncbi:MAG: glycosyltransferase family 2 protein [Candidatus Margulisiibacteriota bacterium]|nr:glycosyltransferase family 2 protein [Candidatus Margulisiibacteriota bacterium]
MFLRLLQIAFLFTYRKKPSEIKIVPDKELPKVSIMIPAYNEEKVIAKTLKNILALDYPDDKLQILIINPSSKDNTASIAREIASRSKRNIKVIDASNDFEHHGKPRALNFGLRYVEGEIIVIYDADSIVDRMAVKHLASYLVAHPEVAMTFGMRKAVNPHGFFARFGYLESLSQQLLTEAAPPREGQKFLFSPGTNVAIRKSVLEELGGWDDNALTEDFELSVRLHSHGYKIEYVHSALSYEEVPEKLRVWVAQRTRWARGGNHVFFKTLKEMRKIFKERKLKFVNFVVLLKVIEFYSPLLALVLANLLFILGMIEILVFEGMGIGFFLWMLFYALLFLQLLACLIYTREINFKNIIVSLLLYFYFQIWLFVFGRVIWLDLVRAPNLWEKTERFSN